MSRAEDMSEGLQFIIEASLRCFLQRMENAPGAERKEQWLESFMQREVRPYNVGQLLERFAMPEKAVLRFLDFVETEGLAQA